MLRCPSHINPGLNRRCLDSTRDMQTPTLVIVHIGEQWPHYLKDCLRQACLMNPEPTKILCIINRCNAAKVISLNLRLHIVFIEDLPMTESYIEFVGRISHMVDLQFRKKYWQYVFERFFILERYCLKYGDQASLYMIETDNLVYVPLQIIQKTEYLFPQGMAAPFDNMEQGYPSLVFFRNSQAVTDFAKYMLECLRESYLSDMKILGKYRKEHPESIFAYPVLPSECNTPLRERKSLAGHQATKEQTSFLSDSRFPILFDAIAFGQALGGIDPRNTNGMASSGYINESALYKVTETQFQWYRFKDLWLPFVNNLPLVNIHIHAKALSCFLSENERMPSAFYNPLDLKNLLEREVLSQ